MQPNVLSQSTLRNLGQKEYEKRKHAALEVENMVRELRDANDFEKIHQLVEQLGGAVQQRGQLEALSEERDRLSDDVVQLRETPAVRPM